MNFIIDAVAFVGFALLTTTGVLMRYILPPGSGHHSTIWRLDRHEWGGIHFWVSVALSFILALHLLLHWRWIVGVLTGRPREASGRRVALGIIGLMAVVSLAISPLISPVESAVNRRGVSSFSSHKHKAASIRGSMTLNEVEEITGVPVSYIIDQLKLPEPMSVEARLGPLKRQHGFEIDDVREIVKRHQKTKQ